MVGELAGFGGQTVKTLELRKQEECESSPTRLIFLHTNLTQSGESYEKMCSLEMQLRLFVIFLQNLDL